MDDRALSRMSRAKVEGDHGWADKRTEASHRQCHHLPFGPSHLTHAYLTLDRLPSPQHSQQHTGY